MVAKKNVLEACPEGGMSCTVCFHGCLHGPCWWQDLIAYRRSGHNTPGAVMVQSRRNAAAEFAGRRGMHDGRLRSVMLTAAEVDPTSRLAVLNFSAISVVWVTRLGAKIFRGQEFPATKTAKESFLLVSAGGTIANVSFLFEPIAGRAR